MLENNKIRTDGLPTPAGGARVVVLSRKTYGILADFFERLGRVNAGGHIPGGWAAFQCDAWEDGEGGYVALCRGGGYHEMYDGGWGIVAFDHPVDGEVDSIDSGAFPVVADDWLYAEWETDPDGQLTVFPILKVGAEVPESEAAIPIHNSSPNGETGPGSGEVPVSRDGHYYRPVAQFVLAGAQGDTIRVRQHFTGGLVLMPDRADLNVE